MEWKDLKNADRTVLAHEEAKLSEPTGCTAVVKVWKGPNTNRLFVMLRFKFDKTLPEHEQFARDIFKMMAPFFGTIAGIAPEDIIEVLEDTDGNCFSLDEKEGSVRINLSGAVSDIKIIFENPSDEDTEKGLALLDIVKNLFEVSYKAWLSTQVAS